MTYSGVTKQPNVDGAIYDRIGCSYDETRQADHQLTLKIKTLLSPHAQGQYLDIGCGSGNYTIALACLGYHMTGVDVSEEMLGKAIKKSQAVTWIKGDANALPFHDSEFDGAICILATHHIQTLDSAFLEAHRILKPGAHFVIFTSTPEQMQCFWLNHYFPSMMKEATSSFLSQNELTRLLKYVGFSSVSHENFFTTNALTDWFLHAGKYRPAIYLDPTVRAGMSFFAKSPYYEEVQVGLDALKNDIDNNKIPFVVFSHPEVASIGLNEKQAQSIYGTENLEIITVPWASNGKARLTGAERGFTKWILMKKRFIACHVIGPGACDLISIAVPMINLGLSVEDAKRWIYPHPTLGEIFAF